MQIYKDIQRNSFAATLHNELANALMVQHALCCAVTVLCCAVLYTYVGKRMWH